MSHAAPADILVLTGPHSTRQCSIEKKWSVWGLLVTVKHWVKHGPDCNQWLLDLPSPVYGLQLRLQKTTKQTEYVWHISVMPDKKKQQNLPIKRHPKKKEEGISSLTGST